MRGAHLVFPAGSVVGSAQLCAQVSSSSDWATFAHGHVYCGRFNVNWLDWLGVGIAVWLAFAVVIGVGFARALARAMEATFERPESKLRS
jgi:hypothetical protein